MFLVFALAGLLWGIGHMMGAPKAARFYMIGLLYVAVVYCCLPLHTVSQVLQLNPSWSNRSKVMISCTPGSYLPHAHSMTWGKTPRI